MAGIAKIKDSDRNNVLEVDEFNGLVTVVDSSVVDATYFKVAENVVFDNLGAVRKREGIVDFGVDAIGSPIRNYHERLWARETTFDELGSGFIDNNEDIVESGSGSLLDGFDGTNNFATTDQYSEATFPEEPAEGEEKEEFPGWFEDNTTTIDFTSPEYDFDMSDGDVPNGRKYSVFGRDVYIAEVFINDDYYNEYNLAVNKSSFKFYDYKGNVYTHTSNDLFEQEVDLPETTPDSRTEHIRWCGILTFENHWTFIIEHMVDKVINGNSYSGGQRRFLSFSITKNDLTYVAGSYSTTDFYNVVFSDALSTHLPLSFSGDEGSLTDGDLLNAEMRVGRVVDSQIVWDEGEIDMVKSSSPRIATISINGSESVIDLFPHAGTTERGNAPFMIGNDSLFDLHGTYTFPVIAETFTEDQTVKSFWYPDDNNDISNINGSNNTRTFIRRGVDTDGTLTERDSRHHSVVFNDVSCLYMVGDYMVYTQDIQSVNEWWNFAGDGSGTEPTNELKVFDSRKYQWINSINMIKVYPQGDKTIKDMSLSLIGRQGGAGLSTFLYAYVYDITYGLKTIFVTDAGAIPDGDVWDSITEGVELFHTDNEVFSEAGFFYAYSTLEENSNFGINNVKINVLKSEALQPKDYNYETYSESKKDIAFTISTEGRSTWLEIDDSFGQYVRFLENGTQTERVLLSDDTEHRVEYINFDGINLIFTTGNGIKVVTLVENTPEDQEPFLYFIVNTYEEHANDRDNTFIEAQVFGYNLATTDFILSIDENKNDTTLATRVAIKSVVNDFIEPNTSDPITSTFIVDAQSVDIWDAAEIKRELYKKDGDDFVLDAEESDTAFVRLNSNFTKTWKILTPGTYIVKGTVQPSTSGAPEDIETEYQVSFIVSDEIKSEEYESVIEEMNRCKYISYIYGKVVLYGNDTQQIYTSNVSDPFYISANNIAVADAYGKGEEINCIVPYKDINIILTNSTISALEGSGNTLVDDPWRILGVDDNVGCIGHDAVTSIDNTVMFQSKDAINVISEITISESRVDLSDMSYSVKKEVSPFKDQALMSNTSEELITGVVLIDHEQRVYALYPGKENRLVIYDYSIGGLEAGKWSVWKSGLDITDMYVNQDDQVMFVSAAEPGKLWKKRQKVVGSYKEKMFETGFYTDGGYSINVLCETHDTTLGDGFTYNKPKKIWVSTSNSLDKSPSYNIGIEVDNVPVFQSGFDGDIYNRPVTGAMKTSTTFTSYKRSNNVIGKSIMKSRSGRNTRIIFTHNLDEPFEINNINLEFTNSKRKNRGALL